MTWTKKKVAECDAKIALQLENWYFIQANQYFMKGDITSAISHYETYIDQAKDPSAAYHNLACCYHMKNRNEEADATFQKATASCSTASVYCEYGHFLYQQTHYVKAVEQLAKVSSYEGDGSRLNYTLVQSRVIESHLRDYLNCYGEFAISPITLADYLLILCYQQQSDDRLMTQVESVETSLLSKEHHSALDYYLLGAVHEVLSNLKESANYFELAKAAQEEASKAEEESKKENSGILDAIGSGHLLFSEDAKGKGPAEPGLAGDDETKAEALQILTF